MSKSTSTNQNKKNQFSTECDPRQKKRIDLAQEIIQFYSENGFYSVTINIDH